MCGITGFVNLDGAPADLALLERMCDLMAYRGPDDAGHHVDGNVGLAARRLAIIDLTEAGHQPMSNQDGSVWVAFNGEIYNHAELFPELVAAGHRFRGRCDTEVIVHAYEEWGADCLARFNGMFAIAVWDARRRRLWLARDRIGVKPLYYAQTAHRFLFGSEIKLLLEDPSVCRRACPEAIAQYLRHGYSIDDRTWFDGIRKVPPGATLTLAEGRATINSFWDPVDRFRHPAPVADAACRIRDLLVDSVRLRLRSDVPVGAHLSGGIDSSAVVALMAGQSAAPVHTFSGAFAEGREFDERRYARLVVSRYATDHHEVEPTSDGFAETISHLVWHMDEPTAGPGVYPQLMVCRLARDSGVIVTNGGQGGDELFGGYGRHLPAYWAAVGDRATATAARARRRAAARQLMRTLATHSRVSGLSLYHGSVRRVLRSYRPSLPRLIDDPLGNVLYNDLRTYLVALLQVEDRTSMATSLESRTPFLDYRLVEFVAGLPHTSKMAGGVPKALLREALHGAVPHAILARTDKRGFPTPIGPWFRGPLHGWLSSVLLADGFAERRVLSRPHLRLMVTAHHAGALDASAFLWSALNLALWFERFRVEPGW
jgi:asparagine synthase (glutamine-hydrolysing)